MLGLFGSRIKPRIPGATTADATIESQDPVAGLLGGRPANPVHPPARRQVWEHSHRRTVGIALQGSRGVTGAPDSRMAMIAAPSVLSANCCAMPCS